MVAKLAEMNESFEAWEEESLSPEELTYYAEVNVRVSEKLLTIA